MIHTVATTPHGTTSIACTAGLVCENDKTAAGMLIIALLVRISIQKIVEFINSRSDEICHTISE